MRSRKFTYLKPKVKTIINMTANIVKRRNAIVGPAACIRLSPIRRPSIPPRPQKTL